MNLGDAEYKRYILKSSFITKRFKVNIDEFSLFWLKCLLKTEIIDETS